MSFKILAINPGSTSTKVAIYEDENEIWAHSISHSPESLMPYPRVFDQLIMRYEMVIDTITQEGCPLVDLDAVVGRGGLLPPVKAGAYRVNSAMVHQLEKHPVQEHPANLGAPLALRVAKQLGIAAYIYDPVTVDEMIDVVRITGRKNIRRFGRGHNLNMRAAAIRYAKSIKAEYSSLNLIVAHLGGGITLSLHSFGRIIDMISDDEGPFSPERAGRLPAYQVVHEAFGGEFSERELLKRFQRLGGLMDHLATTDSREVERRVAAKDEYAALVYDAMALNVAKSIADLSVVVEGRVDAIILTGGIAHSKLFTEAVSRRVRFIAPVSILPGENEMESLALGILRVLRGEETAAEFSAEQN